MNVTKLANELEYVVTSGYRDLYLKVDTTLLQAATMLRQQQAEIEALKKEAALQRLSDFTQEAENKPIAWMLTDGLGIGKAFTQYDIEETGCWTKVPLYAHQAKTLTDEEIEEVYE